MRVNTDKQREADFLISSLREHFRVNSDLALAKKLKVHPSQISRWHKVGIRGVWWWKVKHILEFK